MTLSGVMRVLACGVLLTTAGTGGAATPERTTFGIGDAPPALVPMAWIKFQERAQSFVPGRVYVVNFFASWCGASRQSMTLMTRLSREYADALTIVGVSVRETERAEGTLEAVSRFVAENPERFEYAVAMDNPATAPLFSSWMRGAGMYGTPTAFIIGRDGRVAWIGIPIDDAATYPFEKALADAVAGEVDQAAAKRVHDATASDIAAYLEDKEVMADVEAALEHKEFARALVAIDDVVARLPKYRQRTLYPRITALLNVDEAKALAFIDAELAYIATSDLAEHLELVAGSIGQTMSEHKGLSLTARMRAVELLQRGLVAEPEAYGRVLMLLAIAKLHDDGGERERAVQVQEDAISIARTIDEVSPEMLKQLDEDLAEYRRRR